MIRIFMVSVFRFPCCKITWVPECLLSYRYFAPFHPFHHCMIISKIWERSKPQEKKKTFSRMLFLVFYANMSKKSRKWEISCLSNVYFIVQFLMGTSRWGKKLGKQIYKYMLLRWIFYCDRNINICLSNHY